MDAALKRELNARADVLELAFRLQELALDTLVDTVKEDIDTIAHKRRVRLVRDPYVSGRLTSTGAQDAWIKHRANLALLPNKIEAITGSKKQLKSMRENFIKLRKGDISAVDLDAFTSQLTGFVGLVQTL